MEKKKNKKSKVLIIVLVALLFAAAVGTTIAWLTRTNSITNSFSVGSFEYPTTDPETGDSISITSNLYEKGWDQSEDHKLLPGVSYDKEPYVGIGPGSEDAVVYVYIKNNMSNKVYFTLNTGWEAVSGETTAGSANGTYHDGLFKYTAGLTGSKTADAWTTTPIFSEVVIADDANANDFEVPQGQSTDIVVSSFIHQAKDASGSAISESEVILPAAKSAFGIN